MSNRLADAVSPYLRSHSDNPVHWFAWGPEPFAEAARRDVPVLVSVGYSTCHWCHVMARESFSDPELAEFLNRGFVAIKVDREEHPDVDASYLAAAGAFTGHLGWPLNVFVTPAGLAFFAGTYWPPTAARGQPAFRQVLEAVLDAWNTRRADVESNAGRVAAALREQAQPQPGGLPSGEVWSRIVRQLIDYEDTEFGGFGGAPKFPTAPVLLFLLDRASLAGSLSGDRAGVGAAAAAGTEAGTDAAALAARILATRTLTAMAASELRDEIGGGFFRYSTRRDWTEPHYERMLYDNSMLLAAYSRIDAVPVAAGIVDFLSSVMRLSHGAFASAQDSESTVDGVRVEGEYYRLDAAARARQPRPPLDAKVLTGWNGLAIDALGSAGFRHHRDDWIALAMAAADYLIERHSRADGSLVRASIGDAVSSATATLEDYGMFAAGLLRLALATGEVRYAEVARTLVDATMGEAERGTASRFRAPGGGDPVLAGQGLALEVDPSEGAYPSGLSAVAGAAHTLYLLTADRRYLEASTAAMRLVAPLAAERPIAFGAALSVMTGLDADAAQLVVVDDSEPLADSARVDDSAHIGAVANRASNESVASVARRWQRAGSIVSIVSSAQAKAFADAGFELFDGRTALSGRPTAFLCRDFVCRLPITDAAELLAELGADRD